MNSANVSHLKAEDILSMESLVRRNFVNSLTGFKSVTLIGSRSLEGVNNLAVFSQVIHVGATPPLIGVLFRPHTVSRHTFENILATGSFTLNHFTEKTVPQAHQTSARYGESEFEATGLTPEFIGSFSSPYVKEATIKIGLELVEVQTIKANGTELVIGAIKETLVPEFCIGSDGFVDLEAAQVVTCSGLDSYHSTNKIARFTYAKPGKIPQLIDKILSH
ncbi:MAG: flavin reductase [Imperialibacter sp.]|uniref:flavin reductase family protein n=1 Tax=Imperialibacter sp. TaxID=2038411 RepID=UPI0032F065F7